MIRRPALYLFFFNGLMVYLAKEVNRIVKASFFPRQPADTDSAFLDHKEFSDFLWNMNLYVNCLLLLPALCQLHHFRPLVASVLVWNFYVYQRLFGFLLRLTWYLWWSDLCWAYYGPLVVLGLLLSTLHLALIVATTKLQTEGLEERPPSRQRPHPTIGDGPEH
ncbi:hypothetical protein M5D96_009404 [Drosophila gunungcola]|uniref:Uncharacterized protein n=1 Tax=Drosophila gunungcola TaxID=103775 RepID=A0A9P9YJJ0_9MUSC|nr:hypothetical protein M5D96_009404 [Drosophila gunungcola]